MIFSSKSTKNKNIPKQVEYDVKSNSFEQPPQAKFVAVVCDVSEIPG